MTQTTPAPATVPGTVHRQAQYIAMPDGTPLAVTVFRADDTARPTLLRATRYWRLPRPGEAERVTAAGFALVLVDVRGTGASFGSWRMPWSQQEMDDLVTIVEWVVAQPWSDGSVGAYGTSYDANTAILLAAQGHPAVRAVVANAPDFDAYSQVHHPGGILLGGFIGDWSAMTAALDEGDAGRLLALRGPADEAAAAALLAQLRVDDDVDGSVLASALAAHRDNRSAMELLAPWTDRPDDYDRLSPRSRARDIAASPAYVWLLGSWYDGGTGAGALEGFAALGPKARVTVFASSHGGGSLASPFEPAGVIDPSSEEQTAQHLAFLRTVLVEGQEPPGVGTLDYYVVGAEERRSTTAWPPPGVGSRTWHPTPDHRLTDTSATGRVHYQVDRTTTTDPALNRWQTQLGGGAVRFPDRRAEDSKLLCFTTDELPSPLEIIGHPCVTLDIATDTEDAAVFAYLEVVDADGTVRLLTEGHVRLRHRATATPAPGAGVPFHTHRADTAAAMTPGRHETVGLALLPVAARVPAGSRLRLALAGADAGNFAHVPDGPCRWDVRTGGSFLRLPVRQP